MIFICSDHAYRFNRIITGVFMALLISACTTTQKIETPLSDNIPNNWVQQKQTLDAIKHWSITGKLGVRSPKSSESAVINQWEQHNNLFSINLSSAFLGLGATQIEGSPSEIILQQSGETPLYSDEPERLIWEQTGWVLPLANLPFWIKGMPAPHSENHLKFNQLGQLSHITQDDWQISYSRYQKSDQVQLPAKIKLQQDDILITLIIKSWQIHP